MLAGIWEADVVLVVVPSGFFCDCCDFAMANHDATDVQDRQLEQILQLALFCSLVRETWSREVVMY